MVAMCDATCTADAVKAGNRGQVRERERESHFRNLGPPLGDPHSCQADPTTPFLTKKGGT